MNGLKRVDHFQMGEIEFSLNLHRFSLLYFIYPLLPFPIPFPMKSLPLQNTSHFRHLFGTRFLHNAESIEPAVDQIPCRELNTRRWERSAFQRLAVRVLRKVRLRVLHEDADAYWRGFRNINEVKLVGDVDEVLNGRTDLSTTSISPRSLRTTLPFHRERSGDATVD